MNAKILKNGVLRITANNEDRRNLREEYILGGYAAAEDYVRENLSGYEFVRPEWVAAMTDSPIITNDLACPQDEETGLLPDNPFVGDVWWFPNYMVTDPWERLKNRGKVIFTPEENNKSCPGMRI